jgi:phosphate transport system protein
MLKEFLSLFRSGEPLQAMTDNFSKMLELSLELVKEGGNAFFSPGIAAEQVQAIERRDVEINKLERKIRKQVVVHLSLANNAVDLPHCLVLMSLVKDVERIGDYAKELAGLRKMWPGPLPDDELCSALASLRAQVEADLAAASSAFTHADREAAVSLIRKWRELAERADGLIRKIADSAHSARTAVKLALASRFYGRIAGHVLNLLSGVVMPLHRLDYHDEKDIEHASGLS